MIDRNNKRQQSVWRTKEQSAVMVIPRETDQDARVRQEARTGNTLIQSPEKRRNKAKTSGQNKCSNCTQHKTRQLQTFMNHVSRNIW